MWNQARALRAAGWEVVDRLRPGRRRATPRRYEVLDGIEIHRYPLAPAAGGLLGYAREYAQALWRIRQLVRGAWRASARFDVVHAGNPPDFLLLAVRGLRRQGTRFVFDHHDLVPELYRAKFGDGRGPMHRVALAPGARSPSGWPTSSICTNGSYRAVALERGGRRPEDVFVVRNGPDLDALPARSSPTRRCAAAARHLIGYLGIMGPQDGVDHAIRALAALREQRDDWHAVFDRRRRRRCPRCARWPPSSASATTSSSPAGATTTTSARSSRPATSASRPTRRARSTTSRR